VAIALMPGRLHDLPVGHGAIDRQDDHCADNRSKDAGTHVAGTVDPERAPEESREHGADDAEQDRVMMPPGSLPGITSLATAPTNNPTISDQMMCMTISFRL